MPKFIRKHWYLFKGYSVKQIIIKELMWFGEIKHKDLNYITSSRSGYQRMREVLMNSNIFSEYNIEYNDEGELIYTHHLKGLSW